MKDKLISIVIPMYSEENLIHECYRRVKSVVENNKLNYEMIFINDGSKDKTLEKLKEVCNIDENCKVIDFSRNFGHQIAITAGINNAKGDAVVVIDGDLQDPPELIINMIEKWEQGYDVVYGKRTERKGESLFKLITAKYFYKFLGYMSDINIPRNTGDFRLMDRAVVEYLKNMPEKNRFIRGMVSWIGFKQTYVEFERDKRLNGYTKYSLKKMIKLAEDGIISFSTKPIKFIIKLGIIIEFISSVLLIYGLINNSDHTLILFSMVAFFIGIQVISLGIIGLYVSRIYEESKDRPLYVVKEKINF
jgi:Glycosyltransferases involved in cell wall biogenesis